MYRAYNEGRMEPSDARSPENTTPTSIESFVEDVIVPEARRHFGDA
jgi:hypothetical protein